MATGNSLTNGINTANYVRSLLGDAASGLAEFNVDNFSALGNMIKGNPILNNAFFSTLLEKVVGPKVTTLQSAGKLKFLYDNRGWGSIEEEIAIDIPKAREFDPSKGGEREFKRMFSDIKNVFHTINLETQYGVTYDDKQAERAFTSPEAFNTFVADLIATVQRAADYDEDLFARGTLAKGIINGNITQVQVDLTKANDILRKMKEMQQRLTFGLPKYNTAKIHISTNPSDVYYFMTPEVQSLIEIEGKAGMFHDYYAEVAGNIIAIPDWEDYDEDRYNDMKGKADFLRLTTAEREFLKKVGVVMVDKEWFRLNRAYQIATSSMNQSGLYKNQFLTSAYQLASSPFNQAVALVSNTLTVPETFKVKVTSAESDGKSVKTLNLDVSDIAMGFKDRVRFVKRTEAEVKADGIVTSEFGKVIFTKPGKTKLKAEIDGVVYTATTDLANTAALDSELAFNKG